MVTKTLHPADPAMRCQQAVKAVNDELAALRRDKVWREKEPLEAKKAKELYPDAHFTGIHPIVGIKNFESQNVDDHMYKGRIVLDGHNVRDATGAYAVFSEIGNTPSTMAACRTLVACEAVDPDCRYCSLTASAHTRRRR